VTRSNANLGIVLVVAPLAAVPDGTPLTPAAVAQVLAGLGPADAPDCWQAIRAARPGGMGTRDRWDVAGEPPADMLAAMRAAAPQDQIARLWAHGYGPLFSGLVADLEQELAAGHGLADAIVRGFLRQVAREPDSLIARKHGPAVAAAVSARARAVIEDSDGWREAARRLEQDLHTGRGLTGIVPPADGIRPGTINPGTTADLVAAALYVLLATGRLPIVMPR
jgi:triphosphoribosyl-dephospho-CoA synthase